MGNPKQYFEMRATAKEIISRSGKDEFLAFLIFCSERLNKGDSVQAIWHDFLNSKK